MFHGACDKGCKSPLEKDDTVNEQYPSMLLKRAVGEMAKLPGIGQRTALRLVLSLLRQKPEVALALADSLTRLATEVHYCRECHNISDNDICDICANPARDRSLLCVVENIRGVMSIESTGMYKGLYHVLGGVISPIDGIGPGQLKMDSLVERVGRGEVKEVIIALNPTMEGDTT
ncbi:MAG: recombination protein RecR, partial [Alloprevotella sp.]|nr:recombination protein RecR [Alloprevotella sp.]